MKKNLAVLLILPFLFSVLSVFIVNLTFPLLDVDISRIEWAYDEYEFFFLKQDRYRLNANGFTTSNRTPADGNNLIWTIENVDESEDAHAKIERDGADFYLIPLSEGEVYVTCRNEKGTVSRRMIGLVYLNNAIAVQTAIPASQTNVDPTLYVGTHDVKNGKKVNAVLECEIKAVPSSLLDGLQVSEHSENLSFSFDGKKLFVSVSAAGEASFTVTATDGTSRGFSFRVVEGVNVYTYDDLLFCTNHSESGECMVLRKSFESLDNAFRKKNDDYDVSDPVAENVTVFGHYSPENETNPYSFADEVYSFRTTGNSEYIDQWNEKNPRKQISDDVYAGLHVQKDVYGNGFTINFHNLTYPYDDKSFTSNGNDITVPKLSSANLFRGALPYYYFGDPTAVTPLVMIYGQDNVGMYIDGNDITVNDLRVKGCDEVTSLSFLETVGTVMEVNGQNVLLKNCALSLGRNVLRAFSSRLTVKNCSLSYALNFLFDTGANEYDPIDQNKIRTLRTADGSTINLSLYSYLQRTTKGDETLNQFIAGTGDNQKVTAAFRSLSAALNDASDANRTFAGETRLEDCLFYKSGITAIGMETLFNGIYLLTGNLPSQFSSLQSLASSCNISAIGGLSRPVSVVVSGDTKFYDYKTEADFLIDGMIKESINQLSGPIPALKNVDINTLFPIVSLLTDEAKQSGYTKISGENTILNPIVTKYGGGANRSTIVFSGKGYSSECEIDLLDRFTSTSNSETDVLSMGKRLVLFVIGDEPFRFYYSTDFSLVGKAPSIETLRQNVAV